MSDSSIAAGTLNRRVSIECLDENVTLNASGHVDETLPDNWRLIRANRKCRIVPKGSREFLVGDQLNGQVTHQITMRYDSESATYTEKMRARFGDRVFAFAGPGINVGEDDLSLMFPAVEVQSP